MLTNQIMVWLFEVAENWLIQIKVNYSYLAWSTQIYLRTCKCVNVLSTSCKKWDNWGRDSFARRCPQSPTDWLRSVINGAYWFLCLNWTSWLRACDDGRDIFRLVFRTCEVCCTFSCKSSGSNESKKLVPELSLQKD